jgi:rRNA maturation endonuclease Nob1
MKSERQHYVIIRCSCGRCYHVGAWPVEAVCATCGGKVQSDGKRKRRKKLKK